MLGKVYITVRRPNGSIETKLNEKYTNWTDYLHNEAKKAWANRPEMGELISVKLIENKYKKNPEFIRYNDLYNEGEEGYNPHDPLIFDKEVTREWK